MKEVLQMFIFYELAINIIFYEICYWKTCTMYTSLSWEKSSNLYYREKDTYFISAVSIFQKKKKIKIICSSCEIFNK